MMLYAFRDFLRYYDRTFLLINNKLCYIERQSEERETMSVVDVAKGTARSEHYTVIMENGAHFSMPSGYVNVENTVLGMWRYHNNRTDGMYLRSDGPSHFQYTLFGSELTSYFNHIQSHYMEKYQELVPHYLRSVSFRASTRKTKEQNQQICNIWKELITPNYPDFMEAYATIMECVNIARALSRHLVLYISLYSDKPVLYHRDILVGEFKSPDVLVLSDPSLIEEIKETIPYVKKFDIANKTTEVQSKRGRSNRMIDDGLFTMSVTTGNNR